MKVKITVSAAGADFVLIYGQEMEFDEVKRLIGNGAENFCLPIDPTETWPPAVVAKAPALEPEPETPAEPEPAAETGPAYVEPTSEPEIAVIEPVVETAVKPRGRSK